MKATKLQTKILLTMTLALILSMIITSVITVRLHRSQLIQHHMDYQQSLMQVVKNSIMITMMRNAPEEIQGTLEGIRSKTNIVCLKILSSDGEVKFSTQPGDSCVISLENNGLVPANDMECYSFQESYDSGMHTMIAIAPIENQPRCYQCHDLTKPIIGYLAVESDISSIDRNIKSSQTLTFLISLGTLLILAISITVVHLRFVQRGLGKVLKAITEVEQGNFQTHINVPSSDEMGRLAASFNRMIDHLNQARKEVNLLHQEQLERAGKLANVGELAAGMAHEIRNPVAGVSSALKVILEDIDVDDVRRPIFDEILRQLDRVNRALNDLLSFARPQAPSFIELNVSDVVNNSLKLASQQAGLAKIDIECIENDNLPLIYADPVQLEQVLVNLIMNGIQAMPHGGKLIVDKRYDSVQNCIEIKVSDTGSGIPSKNLQNIFKPFYTTKHKGTGLGLAISQGIIERHGGRIEVCNSPDHGAVFTIILPVEGLELTRN